MSRDDVHVNYGVTLAVLAGGEGRRMGRAKGEIRLGGTPILQYLLSRWRWPGPTLLVTAPGREHPPGCELFEREAVDPVAQVGPLRGILTAVENCATDRLVVTTVDMPGVTSAQLRWLVDRAAEHCGSLGVFCSVSSTLHGKQIEPFPSLLRVEARQVIARQLAGGDASVQSVAQREEFAIVPTPPDWPDRVWSNLNRPDDLRQFEKDTHEGL